MELELNPRLVFHFESPAASFAAVNFLLSLWETSGKRLFKSTSLHPELLAKHTPISGASFGEDSVDGFSVSTKKGSTQSACGIDFSLWLHVNEHPNDFQLKSWWCKFNAVLAFVHTLILSPQSGFAWDETEHCEITGDAELPNFVVKANILVLLCSWNAGRFSRVKVSFRVLMVILVSSHQEDYWLDSVFVHFSYTSRSSLQALRLPQVHMSSLRADRGVSVNVCHHFSDVGPAVNYISTLQQDDQANIRLHKSMF